MPPLTLSWGACCAGACSGEVAAAAERADIMAHSAGGGPQPAARAGHQCGAPADCGRSLGDPCGSVSTVCHGQHDRWHQFGSSPSACHLCHWVTSGSRGCLHMWLSPCYCYFLLILSVSQYCTPTHRSVVHGSAAFLGKAMTSFNCSHDYVRWLAVSVQTFCGGGPHRHPNEWGDQVCHGVCGAGGPHLHRVAHRHRHPSHNQQQGQAVLHQHCKCKA